MATDRMIKSGFVSIIGLPNSGKSSFLNVVLNDKIAITSKRPQTTRKNLKGIYNDDDSQIVFVDTPGVHNVKNKLDEYMSKSIIKSTSDIDMLIVIVDIMTYENDNYDKLNSIIINTDVKKLLLINKCDLKEFDEEKSYSEIISKFDSKVIFDKHYFISALKNKNIDEVIKYVKECLPYGDKYYSDEYITDEPMKQVVADMIRQQCLYKLDKEIPHGIAVIVDGMKMSNSKCMNIDATIVCEKDRHKSIIIGSKGNMIKNIGTGARIAIEKFLGNKTNLKLNVIVRENWRTEKTLLANYGYDSRLL